MLFNPIVNSRIRFVLELNEDLLKDMNEKYLPEWIPLENFENVEDERPNGFSNFRELIEF